MLATSRNFEANARKGLADGNLQRALALMRSGFPERRRLAVDRFSEFEALREAAKSIKDHTLEHLDFYLAPHRLRRPARDETRGTLMVAWPQRHRH